MAAHLHDFVAWSQLVTEDAAVTLALAIIVLVCALAAAAAALVYMWSTWPVRTVIDTTSGLAQASRANIDSTSGLARAIRANDIWDLHFELKRKAGEGAEWFDRWRDVTSETVFDAHGTILTAGMDAPDDAVLRRMWQCVGSITHAPSSGPDSASPDAAAAADAYWTAVFVALQQLYSDEQPSERRKRVHDRPSIFAPRLPRPHSVIAPSRHTVTTSSCAEIVVARSNYTGDARVDDDRAERWARAYLAKLCLRRLRDLKHATDIPLDTVTTWRFVAMCTSHTKATFHMLRIKRNVAASSYTLVWYHTAWFNFAATFAAPPLGMQILCKLLHATHEQLGYQVVHRADVMGGKYRVDNILGSGGFCDVYEVVGGVGGAPAVAKVIRHKDAASNTIALEIEALRALQPCKYTPTLVDSDESCLILQPMGKPLPVMLDELYVGFAAWDCHVRVQPQALRQKRMKLALQVARDVSAALKHAHARGYAHLDVRLPNMLCANESDQRRFVLADWGVSQKLTPVSALQDVQSLFCVVAVIAGPTDGHSQYNVEEWASERWGAPSADDSLLELFAQLPGAVAAYTPVAESPMYDDKQLAIAHACLDWLEDVRVDGGAASTRGSRPRRRGRQRIDE